MLDQSPVYAVDTETYGLSRKDRPFSIQISNGHQTIYVDFRHHDIDPLDEIFKRDALFVFFNASFDMQKLSLVGYHPRRILDVKELCRIAKSDFLKLNLDMALKHFLGIAKNDEVKTYMKSNKLTSYADVPLDIMERYGKADALNTFQLYKHLITLVSTELVERTEKITRVIYDMGSRGIRLDQEKLIQGRDTYQEELTNIENKITQLAGEPYTNGPLWMKAFFDRHSVPYKIKKKTGNPMFSKKELKKINHPVAGLVCERRHYDHFVNNFFKNILSFGHEGLIYAYPDPAGAETGRFAYREPNLMNIPKERREISGKSVSIKDSFIPREGYKFASIDFSQQEFRLLLDFANQRDVINEVMGGKDVHQATADKVKVERSIAKNVAFGLLYGVGNEALGAMLGTTTEQASIYRQMFFNELPKVKEYINYVISQAKINKCIRNPTGRVLRFANPDFAYAAPNYLIQGYGADIMKSCMIRVSEYINKYMLDLHIVLTVHDELLLEFKSGLEENIKDVSDLMKNAYKPINGMFMDTDIHISDKSWGDCK